MSEGDDSLDGKIASGEDPTSETTSTSGETPPAEATHPQTDSHNEGKETGQIDNPHENNNNINESTDGAVEVTKEPADKANVEVEAPAEEETIASSLSGEHVDTHNNDSITKEPSQPDLDTNTVDVENESSPEPEFSEEQPSSNVGVVLEASTEKENSEPEQTEQDETDIMWELDPAPQTPTMGEIDTTPITTVHSLGDLHGWAPGLISYLIENKLATVSIGGVPMQHDDGTLHIENLNSTFPNPTLNWPSLPKSGLKMPEKLGKWYGVQNGGHAAIHARWIADPEVAFVQVGDIFDRADHSELAAEILRQLIIDAPGRVFALVGNHEQFMLENDYQNWAHNEIRSAHTDYDVGPKEGQRAHFRFINPAIDQHEVMQEVFDRYTNSVWTLFLTQGAVMNKLGWVDDVVADISSLETMLEEGWTPYEHAKKLRETLGLKGKEIPGAVSALTINDILFHHAEPAAHQTNRQGTHIALYETISEYNHPALNQFKIQMYRHGGGSLHDSADQTLLWARGSSSGANSGQPSAQEHLEHLAANWPGLHRIVHGHTPTVGLSEFSNITSGESRPVSYNADHTQAQPVKGRANKIRVHNIDEGMSPVYFQHSMQNPYDPCRAPIGLRMELEGSDMPEASSETSELVPVPPSGSMEEDRRKLWLWQPGEWKTNLPTEPQLVNGAVMSAVNYNDWKGVLLVGDSPNQDELLAALIRKINGRMASSFLIEQCMNKVLGKKLNTIPRQITYIPIFGDDLHNGKTISILRANNISLLFAKATNTGMEIIVFNGFEGKHTFELTTAQSLEAKSTVRSIETKPFTVTHTTLSNTAVAIISLGNRAKSGFKFFSSQEGKPDDSLGSFGYYFTTASESKTPTFDDKDIAEMPTPQPKVEINSPVKNPEPRQQSGSRQGGLQSQTTDQKKNDRKVGMITNRGGIQRQSTKSGLKGQVSNTQQPKKSDDAKGIHGQTGADKGKVATSSQGHGITSQVTSPSNSHLPTDDGNKSNSSGNRLTNNFRFNKYTFSRKIREDLIEEIDKIIKSKSSESVKIESIYTLERELSNISGFVFCFRVVRSMTGWMRLIIKCDKFESLNDRKKYEKNEPNTTIAMYALEGGKLENVYPEGIELIPGLMLKEAKEILDQLNNKVVELFSIKSGD